MGQPGNKTELEKGLVMGVSFVPFAIFTAFTLLRDLASDEWKQHSIEAECRAAVLSGTAFHSLFCEEASATVAVN